VRSAIYTVPVKGGTVTCLTADHPATDLRPRYSPDGKAIIYGMTRDPDFYADRVQLMRYDRATATHTEIVTGWDRSPSDWEFAKDGTLYLVTEDRGRVSVFVVRTTAAPSVVVQGGSAGGLAVASGRLFFTHQTIAQPCEAFTCGLDGKNLTRLTHFTDDVMNDVATGEVREMHFEGARGETVQMFVVLPPGYEEGEKRPLVQVIHGGPHGISADVFHMRWNPQLFAAPGYVTAMVNFQGSTSWGQEFAKVIQGAWAERPFEDVMRATDLLIAAGYADEHRMAAAGGSYGGYMAAWVAGHTDRFKCIVNHAGVYDTLAQYASDWTMGRGQAWGGEAWDKLEAIDACNPARSAKHMNTPMLVIHGERDYRVPVNHGLECYGMLKAKGVPARLVYFPDENHWVLKPRNSILWSKEVHAWLARWLVA
jgi:dipeptidyl aminopeptidase/acylaminoacyl peptidase